jgi:hypothetical protein
MVVSTDPDYIETKIIKRGHKQLDPIFQRLADWIDQTYGTPVLNIYYDKIEVDKNRPRLNIIFEFFPEAEKFKDKIRNFDPIKQKAVTDKFRVILKHPTSTSNLLSKLLNNLVPPRYNTKNLLVIFDSFEPIAREEANQNIPETEIEKLKTEIGMKDLWTIYRQFSVATFFFYTGQQLETYSTDGTTDSLKEKYYNLLKRYDEFGYINPDTYFIRFDTKENFDKNYQSSWFYYSR